MRVDGREVTVSGSLLQPLARRTSDIIRLALATVFLAAVITSSLITRYDWVSLEKSISEIVGVLTHTQSNLVYLAYGLAILALPFAILVGLIVTRQWKLLGAYGAAGLIALLALSVSPNGIAAPQWHFYVGDQPKTFLSQFLDDPRWIAMLAAMLTVSGPWLPARWRHWWWALLLAFVPIHLVVSAVVPARSLLGLAVGWFVGALVVLVVGTPALEVPLDGAVRAMARRGCTVTRLTVVRPAGPGALILTGKCDDDSVADLELYGPNQRSGGVLNQLWRKFTLRGGETAPFHASMRRAVEHRALMAIAIADLGVANASPLAVAPLSRGWTLYAHTPARGTPLNEAKETTLVARVWGPLRVLHDHQISHGDLRANKITIDDGTALFGGFDHAEYGATDAQLQSDIAQLMVTTSALYDPPTAVRTAIGVFGEGGSTDGVPPAHESRCAQAYPGLHPRRAWGSRRCPRRGEAANRRRRDTVRDDHPLQPQPDHPDGSARCTGLRRVAVHQHRSDVPVRTQDGELVVGTAGAGGVGAEVPWCGGRPVGVCRRAGELPQPDNHAGGQHLCRHDHPRQASADSRSAPDSCRRVGSALCVPPPRWRFQQSVQVVTHIVLLILFSAFAGASADLSHFVPSMTIVYLVGGVILLVVAAFGVVPRLRKWLAATVGPRVNEVLRDLRELASEPRRLVLIILGCAATTLGAAMALWACISAFGGDTSFVTVTVVTMIGGTLASAAPTPGGVGAVEAALYPGGLAAFGVPAGIAVPSVLLYRVLTCWLPVFVGWFLMRWLTEKQMI